LALRGFCGMVVVASRGVRKDWGGRKEAVVSERWRGAAQKSSAERGREKERGSGFVM